MPDPVFAGLGDWDAIVVAAKGGLLDECLRVELKEDLGPSSRGTNTELAKDLAALSQHGGLLIVGIQDRAGCAGEVVGAATHGLADRITSVAQRRISPPLRVMTRVIAGPDGPDHGCVLVHVPASPSGPHMVDHRYWGRTDIGKVQLDDVDVAALMARRRTADEDLLAQLRRLEPTVQYVPVVQLWMLSSPRAATHFGEFTRNLDLAGLARAADPGSAVDSRFLAGVAPVTQEPHSVRTSWTGEPQGSQGFSEMVRLAVHDGSGILTAQAVFASPQFSIPYMQSTMLIRLAPLDPIKQFIVGMARLTGMVGRELDYVGPWWLGMGLRSNDSRAEATADSPAIPDVIESTGTDSDVLEQAPEEVARQILGPVLRTLNMEW